MISVLKKITQCYMRKGKKQGHEYSITWTLRRHTPHIQISLKCPPPPPPAGSRTKTCFFVEQYPGAGGDLEFPRCKFSVTSYVSAPSLSQ